jgi:sulfur carrier protein
MTRTASPARIQVNGEDEPLEAATLAALLEQKEIAPARRGVAVAVNGTVIPRAAWASTPLHPGDRVEIVRVLQGG